MLAVLLQVALLSNGVEDPSTPLRSLVIPMATHPSSAPVDIRLDEARPTFPVAPGVTLRARIHGDLLAPLTDPGRTQIRVELVLPLLARNGRTVLLPAGTRLIGRVHLLRGTYSFVGFQALTLPDGRSVGLSEDSLRLGPDSPLQVQQGAPALLTVWRPLRMEAFGPLN